MKIEKDPTIRSYLENQDEIIITVELCGAAYSPLYFQEVLEVTRQSLRPKVGEVLLRSGRDELGMEFRGQGALTGGRLDHLKEKRALQKYPDNNSIYSVDLKVQFDRMALSADHSPRSLYSDSLDGAAF